MKNTGSAMHTTQMLDITKLYLAKYESLEAVDRELFRVVIAEFAAERAPFQEGVK